MVQITVIKHWSDNSLVRIGDTPSSEPTMAQFANAYVRPSASMGLR